VPLRARSIAPHRRIILTGVGWIFGGCVVGRTRILECLICEPIELCLDARDECAPCGKPIVAPPNQCEELFETCDFSEHADHIDAVAQIEERRSIRTFCIVQSIDDHVTKRRQRRGDTAASYTDRVAIDDLREAGLHRKRVHTDVAQRVHGGGLTDAFGLARRVLDRLRLRPHELAQQLLEQSTTLALRALHTGRVCSGHAARFWAFPRG
jgi:hypothetical protein